MPDGDDINDPRLFGTQAWTDWLYDAEPAELLPFLKKNTDVVLKRLKGDKGVARALAAEFEGKEEIIKMMIVCAIAQQPMLLVGDPGTGKSRLVTRLCELLGIVRFGGEGAHKSFTYLLHSFTEPDELLGLLHIDSLKKGVFKRLREGSMTSAAVIFLDEVFRANAAILNALLTIINERRVYEAGEAIHAKARMIFGASNDPPSPAQRKDLAAFYSRFAIRVACQSLPRSVHAPGKDAGPRRRLLEKGFRNEVNDQRKGFDPARTAPEPIACLNDILFLNRCATEFWGADNLDVDSKTVDPQIKKFVPMYHGLDSKIYGEDHMEHSVTIDDRKFVRLFMVARAHALYEHNGAPAVEDLTIMRHTWEDLAGREHLARVVDEFIRSQSAST